MKADCEPVLACSGRVSARAAGRVQPGNYNFSAERLLGAVRTRHVVLLSQSSHTPLIATALTDILSAPLPVFFYIFIFCVEES